MLKYIKYSKSMLHLIRVVQQVARKIDTRTGHLIEHFEINPMPGRKRYKLVVIATPYEERIVVNPDGGPVMRYCPFESVDCSVLGNPV